MLLQKLSFSKKEYLRGCLLLILIFIILISFSVYLFYKGWQNFNINSISLALIVGLITGIIFLYISKFFYKLLIKIGNVLLNKIRIARLGIEGEKNGISEIKKIFNFTTNFEIYENFIIPDYKFDIDVIVATLIGIFIFEIKNPFQKLYFRKNQTMTKKFVQDDWYPLPFLKDPIKRTKWHVQKLQEYLDIDVDFIKPAILIINEKKCKIYEDYDNKNLPIICGLINLKKYIKNVQNTPISLEIYKKINEKLSKPLKLF